jgi:hypothetical protein
MADPTFWEHSGYVLTGLDTPDLHPTLAQQLVSNLLLWDEKLSFERAVRERLLGAQVTYQYGRTQVLEWYLNSANYGNFAYGADAAAQLYFGKSAAALTPAEAAILAAVSQAPSLNPLDAPQAALQRGRETIHIMQALGFLSDVDAEKALAESPTFSLSPSGRGDRGEGVSVLISTPYMDEASRCHRVGFMKAGRIIAEDTPSNLRARLNGRVLQLRGSPIGLLRHVAHRDEDVEDVQAFGDRLHIRVREKKSQDVLSRLKSEIESEGGQVDELRSVPPVLEDVFIALSE